MVFRPSAQRTGHNQCMSGGNRCVVRHRLPARLTGLAEQCIIRASSKEVQPWVAAVSGVGGLIVGLVVGLLGAIFFLTRQRRRQHDRVRPDMLHRKSSSMSITTPVLAHQEPYTDAHTPPPDSHL